MSRDFPIRLPGIADVCLAAFVSPSYIVCACLIGHAEESTMRGGRALRELQLVARHQNLLSSAFQAHVNFFEVSEVCVRSCAPYGGGCAPASGRHFRKVCQLPNLGTQLPGKRDFWFVTVIHRSGEGKPPLSSTKRKRRCAQSHC